MHSYEQEFNSHPRPQFLLEEGIRDFAGKAKDCQRDGYPDLKGWVGTENRQYDIKSPIWEKVRFISYNKRHISYIDIFLMIE